jgi:hypothetical protein
MTNNLPNIEEETVEQDVAQTPHLNKKKLERKPLKHQKSEYATAEPL